MNKAIFLLSYACCLTAAAAPQSFRLEIDGSAARIVGVDGVRREVVLVAPEEYAALTNNAVEAWKKLHETEAGRVKLHGRRVNTSVMDGKVRVDTYADGFRMPFPMSPRHLEFRAIIDEKKKHRTKPKEVTLEHDAATGKDTVK